MEGRFRVIPNRCISCSPRVCCGKCSRFGKERLVSVSPRPMACSALLRLTVGGRAGPAKRPPRAPAARNGLSRRRTASLPGRWCSPQAGGFLHSPCVSLGRRGDCKRTASVSTGPMGGRVHVGNAVTAGGGVIEEDAEERRVDRGALSPKGSGMHPHPRGISRRPGIVKGNRKS